MAPNQDARNARQSEGSTNTFWILIISTAVAAAIAIAGYVYVFSAPNTELRDQGASMVEPQGEGAADAEGGSPSPE